MGKISILWIFLMLIMSGCQNAMVSETLNPSSDEISSVIASESHNDKDEAVSIDKQTLEFSTLNENFHEITQTQRKRGTDGEKRTIDFISEQMKSFGYDVTVQPFEIFETSLTLESKHDYFNLNPLNAAPVSQGYNLIANLNYDENKKTMIFCAHYDTTTDSIGALDNGTGTAALLEAAKLVKDQTLDYNLRIIFFSSEEYYFYGSRSYVNSLSKKDLSNIVGCFNVDMVGSKECREILIQTSPLEENWITREYKRINGNFVFRQAASSDQVPFQKKGIPAIHFTTVDTRNRDFDERLFVKEETTEAVSLENLELDAKLVKDMIVGLDIYANVII